MKWSDENPFETGALEKRWTDPRGTNDDFSMVFCGPHFPRLPSVLLAFGPGGNGAAQTKCKAKKESLYLVALPQAPVEYCIDSSF